MARRFDIEVLIGANDKASSKLNKVAIATAAITAAVGIAAFAAAKAAGIQEQQEIKLTSALRNVESASKDGAAELIELAAAMQKTTGFVDEQIISAQAMLATFQLNEKQIAQITPRLLDMAAATEKATGQQTDLQAVAIALGKGFTGQAGQLARYGVILSDATKKSGDFNAILTDLDANFKGIAEDSAEGFIGKTKILRARLGDMVETVGKSLIPVFNSLIDTLSEKILPVMEEWLRINADFITKVLPQLIALIVVGLIPAIQSLWALAAANPFVAVLITITAITSVLDGMIIKADQATNSFRTLSEERLGLLKQQRDALMEATKEERALFAEGKARLGEESDDLLQLHELTKAIRFIEMDLANRKLQQDIDNNDKKIENEIWSAERQKAIDASVAASQDRHRKARLKADKKMTDARILMITSITDSMQAGFVSMLKAEDNFAVSAKKIFAGVRDSIINMIAERISAEIAAWAITKILHIKEAQTKAVTAHAKIPFVGLAIGLGFAAAMSAAIKGFANGVRNFAGGWAVVGESGRELVNLGAGSSVISNTQTEGLLAGTSRGNMTFVFTGNQIMGDNAIEEFSEKIGDNIMDRVKRLINVS